jgi:hypothetical protein
MPVLCDLRTALTARAAGLDEPTVRVLIEHAGNYPGDNERRALALAVMVRDLGAGADTLRAVLLAGLTPDRLLGLAVRHVDPRLYLPKTGQRAIWATCIR